MKRQDIVNKIAEEVGISKKDADKALKVALNCVHNSMVAGDPVSFIGFGSFKVVDRVAREGVNPQTGTKIKIPASKAVKFTAGKVLKEAVNAKKRKKQ